MSAPTQQSDTDLKATVSAMVSYLRDVSYWAIFLHALGVGFAQMPSHYAIRQILLRKCITSPSEQDLVLFGHCLESVDSHLAGIRSKQSKLDSFGFITAFIWFTIAKHFGRCRELLLIVIACLILAQAITIVVCLEFVPSFFGPKQLPFSSLVNSISGGELLYTGLAFSLVPIASRSHEAPARHSNLFLAEGTYSAAMILSNFVMGRIMMAHNPVSLYVSIWAHIASLICTWQIPRRRLSSHNPPPSSTTNILPPESSMAAETNGGTTPALETTPLLQSRSLSYARRMAIQSLYPSKIHSIWRGLFPEKLHLTKWNIVIMLLTTMLMSTPPFINDLISLYGCSRYTSAGQQLNSQESPCVRDTNDYVTAGRGISLFLDLMLGTVFLGWQPSTSCYLNLAVGGATFKGLASLVVAVASTPYMFHDGLLADACGNIYYMSAQILTARIRTPTDNEPRMPCSSTATHPSAPGDNSALAPCADNTQTPQERSEESVDALAQTLVYFRIAMGVGALGNNHVLKKLYDLGRRARGNAPGPGVGGGGGGRLPPGGRQQQHPLLIPTILVYGLPFVYLGFVELAVSVALLAARTVILADAE